MNLGFLIASGDDFSMVLSRIQQDCSDTLCLVDDKTVHKLSAEDISKLELHYDGYILPADNSLAPIYQFTRDEHRYSFFGSKAIVHLLPLEIRGRSNTLEFLRDYSVFLQDSGIWKEFRQRDNITHVERVAIISEKIEKR